MKFDDILTFVKAGYKPSDIKELLEMETSSEVKAEDNQIPEKTIPEESAEEDKPEAEEIDYKKLYEQTKTQLAQIQSDNVKKDNSNHNTQTDDEVLADLVKAFY